MRIWAALVFLFLLVSVHSPTALSQGFGTNCISASPKFGFNGTTDLPGFKCFQYSLGSRVMVTGATRSPPHVTTKKVDWYLQTIQSLKAPCNEHDGMDCSKTLSRLCATSMQSVSVAPGLPPVMQAVKISDIPAECPTIDNQPNVTGPGGCSKPCVYTEIPIP
jgi:hypothetical protein